MSIIASNNKDSLRPRRRCVRRENVLPCGTVQCVTKSFSNDADKWHPCFDVTSRTVFCDCPDFTHRCAKLDPTLDSPALCLCKHLVFPILNAIRRGDLEATPARFAELEAAAQRKAGFSKTPEAAKTLAQSAPLCVVCKAAPTVYATCNSEGRLVNAAGVCADCAPMQLPTEEDLMHAAVAAYKLSVQSFYRPCDQATMDALNAEADEARRAANELWLNECVAAVQLEEARTHLNRLLWLESVGEYVEEDDLYQAQKAVEAIEREHPFIDDPDCYPAEPPYPDAAPFI